jgi:hypothetical protein
MTTVVETVSEMYTPISILSIVVPKRSQSSQLDLSCITVLLHGAYDFHGHELFVATIVGFDNFAKGTLTKKAGNAVYHVGQ